jgi:hypothetical protein
MQYRQRCAIVCAAAVVLWGGPLRAADNPHTSRATIDSVRPSAHEVTVQTDEGKQLVLQIDDRSRLEQQGRAVSLDQFHPGMEVQIAWESRDGSNRLVSMTAAPVTAEEVQREIQDVVRAARSYTFQQKDVYRRKLERVLRHADARIDQLREQAAQAGSRAKQEYKEQIEKLRQLRARAQDQVDRVKSATPGAWEELKAGMGSALEDMHRAFQRAAEHFR